MLYSAERLIMKLAPVAFSVNKPNQFNRHTLSPWI